MNERIEELAKQAEILFYKGRIPETGYEYEGAEVTKEDLQKFAELLIRECIMVCINELADPRDTVEQKCAAKITRHFGVK